MMNFIRYVLVNFGLTGFLQLYGIGQQCHRKAILLILLCVCELKAADFFVDIFDDFANGMFVARLDFQRIRPARYQNRDI